MFSRKCTILAAAAAVFGYGAASRAVTISEYYIDGQIATNSSFTSGLQDIDLSGSAPTVNLPKGDFFRFGVSLVVTNNPNPAAGDAWDLANQSVKGNPPQPQYLGLSGIGFDIPSTDPAGYSFSPVLGPSTGIGVAYPQNYSTAVFSPGVDLFDYTNPGNVESGVVSAMDIFFVDLPQAESQDGVSQLALFGGMSATPSQAVPLFTQLAYQSNAAGTVTLSPSNSGVGIPVPSYWVNEYPGSVNARGNPSPAATYASQGLSPSSDIINALPALTINVTPIQPIISVSSSATPTTYDNLVPLYGPPRFSSFTIYASSPIQERTFYIKAPDANPASPFIIVAFDLQERSVPTLTGDIAQLVEDINGINDGIVAYSGVPGYPYLSPPYGTYNFALAIPQADFSPTTGITYLGIDLKQVANIPDISNIYVSGVAVLPEPASTGLLMVAAASLLGRRRRNSTLHA
jgi:hypothetical protein